MDYRVIALDLDGTLLTSQKQVLPESIDALTRAKAAGYRVLIVTGRHHSAIHPIYQTLALTDPVICCNGTYSYDYQTNSVINSDPLPAKDTEIVIDALRQADIKGLLYAGDAMYYEQPTAHVIRMTAWAENYPPALRPVFRQVDDLRAVIESGEPLWKFALAHADLSQLQSFAHQVEASAEVVCEWSWTDQIDIAKRGNSKGKRLAEWVNAQNLSMEQVVAFGDNNNDLSMLELAGIGVAMQEAKQEIKDRCQVVIGSNDAPSIAQFIESKLL
ncbi:pyridoxal phosphatase [Tatumella ptyseos]|uniref:pyridoxal phosphatase n=1 Tax=Tatumella ptyseos TaxID=82987 RepID=UPI0026F04257|nr:pyridoxal phosphatase [Tatumella ptyseos]WKX27514.1 pyridoxal phosphatase [Tatumella ptyseos]